MSTKFFFFAIGALAVFSCAKVEPSTPAVAEAQTINSDVISIRIVNEGDDATKSYYTENPSYWTYNWEHNDYFRYFYYSGDNQLGTRLTSAVKTEEATRLLYNASDLQIGNTLYSFYIQKDMFGQAMTNTNPNALNMVIPTAQVTTMNPEKYLKQLDASFTLKDITLDNISGTGTIQDWQMTIPSRTVTFKIDGYNADFQYLCALATGSNGGVSNFSCDAQGNASVTVSFKNYAWGDTQAKTTFTVYNTYDEEATGNSVNVIVYADRANGLLDDQITYTTALGTIATADFTTNVNGEVKPYPIRDAMPCASQSKLVTSSLLRFPEDIANSMTMYMLGSAAEFRVYSKTGRFTGEKIEKVIVTSLNGPCGGYCNYDILSQSLEITGYNEDTITSDVSTCDYHVPTVKGDEESVYMVLAPGTYDLQINVITTDGAGVSYNNVFTTTGQTFTRANRKPFAVNLESANADRYPVAAPNGDEEGESDL